MADDRRDGSGPLSPEEVRRIADLAALELSDDEVDRLTVELADILGHFDALDAGAEDPEAAQDAQHGQGARDAEGAKSAGRPDQPGPDPLVRPPEADAPAFEDGFFTVPRLESHAEDTEDTGGAS